MKKSALLVVLVVLLMTSCAHVSQFLENDPYLSSFGKDGDFIFSQTLDITDFEKFNVVFNRVSGGFDPETGEIYGALEGTFAKQKVKLALNHTDIFSKSGNGIWTSEEYGISIMVPANGIILFSSDDVKDFYQNTYVNRSSVIPVDISYLLVGSETGFFVKNPSVLPDIGFNLSQEAVESFDYILSVSDGFSADYEFSMKSDAFAESLLKIIKTAVVTEYRKKGLKVDTKYLNSIIFMQDNTVFLKEQEPINIIPENLIDSFTEVM